MDRIPFMSEINFLKGHPSHSLLPRTQIAKAYEKVLLRNDYTPYETDPFNQHPLSYGTDPGNLDVRNTIARWNDTSFDRRTTPLDPDCLNLTGGASYGFINILNLATDVASGYTKRAFIVSPCYYLINGAFVDAGFEGKITAIEEMPQNDGYDVDLDALEHELKQYSTGLDPLDSQTGIFEDSCGRGLSKIYRFVIYIVPTFSNPGGLTYSVKTRTRLLELAREYDMLVVSDDVYELLDYREDTATPVPRVVYLDRDSKAVTQFGNSVSNGTFSKLIAPGLRCGWQETATPMLAQQLSRTGANKSGGTPGQLATFVVRELIESDELDAIIANFKKHYKARARKLIECKKYLPPQTQLYGGDGGYFFWVNLPDSDPAFDHRKIVKVLKEKYKITLAPGESFEVHGDPKGWGRHSVRLSISLLSEQQIEDGIKRWAEVLREHHPELFE